MKARFTIILTIIAISASIPACKKVAPECKGNCSTINANGRVVNKLSSETVAGVPVSLNWVELSGGFSQSEVITTVKSKADGTFNLTAMVDTSYFSRGYFLSLRVDKTKDFIILGYSGLIETRTYSPDPNAFVQKQFEVYKKAMLKIRLHRNQTDSFTQFAITHSNVTDFFLYDYNVQSPQEVIARNTSELNIETVADIYTKVQTQKTLPDGSIISTLDSVICTTSSNGIIDVNF